MPRTLSPAPCNLSPPPARYRHSGYAGTSDLSIWLSVDPMSDKYPGVSPYTYCGNNPVKLVDPNGEDIYEFDESGNFIQRIPHEYDMVRIINNETKDVTQSQEYEKGTIFQLETDIAVNTKKQNCNLQIFFK